MVLSSDISNVFWIGGSFSGGKSTTAKRLCADFGLNFYQQDWHLLQDPAFAASRVKDGSWFWLPNDQKFERYRRAFPMCVEQIWQMAGTGPTLVEGPGLLPELLAGIEVQRPQAVYLLPTPDFQRWANRHRSATSQHGNWVEAALSNWEDPAGAWERWMALDDQFAYQIERAALSHDYTVVRVDRGSTISDVAATAATHFGLIESAEPRTAQGHSRSLPLHGG